MFLSRPEPVTIAVCDGVHLDPVTKRKTLVGVYPHVVADAFPLTLAQAWLYVPFTGAQGMLAILLRVRSPDGAALYEAVAEATCGDPASNYEMTAPLTNLTFAAPGTYVIEALADGVPFARRELRVIAKDLAKQSLIHGVSTASRSCRNCR
jgi:hypothetical protein